MRILIFLLALLQFSLAEAQNTFEKQGGNFSLGMRSTVSAFSHGEKNVGYGAGGQFRIQLTDRINTEWFLDVLSTNIENKAQRMDYHVGWSVMYYLIDPRAFTRKVTPYVVAGHCFDFTKISINGNNGDAQSRFSSAVQAGVGFHYNITPKLDLSPQVQYMLHLGKDLHAHVTDEGVELEEHARAGWEGHLLFNLSMNYKFAQLWKPGKKS
ncbi:MAG: outer membrane beta-barrel protein [Chitinophagales bacterium]|nr:outer membrane beta-barrel protein [Chitinophagales bacterium]